MKKLMIAALAVASCATYASVDDKQMTENAVYDLSFTTKYLDYPKVAMPNITFKEKAFTAKNYEDAMSQWEGMNQAELLEKHQYVVFKGAKEKDGGDKLLAGKVIAIFPFDYGDGDGCRYVFQETIGDPEPGSVSDYAETIKTYPIYKVGTNTKGKPAAVTEVNIAVVTKISYKMTDKKKAGKLVTKNLNGMLIVDDGNVTPFIWNSKVKDFVGVNPFAGSKGGKPIQLATASDYLSSGFEFSDLVARGTIDGKNTDGGFVWDHFETTTQVRGWGSGTVKAWPVDKEYNVVSTLQGNFAGVTGDACAVPAQGEFGTWKLTYNDKATKILLCREDGYQGNGKPPARKYDGVDFNAEGKYIPESYEEILGTKKVERVD